MYDVCIIKQEQLILSKTRIIQYYNEKYDILIEIILIRSFSYTTFSLIFASFMAGAREEAFLRKTNLKSLATKRLRTFSCSAAEFVEAAQLPKVAPEAYNCSQGVRLQRRLTRHRCRELLWHQFCCRSGYVNCLPRLLHLLRPYFRG